MNPFLKTLALALAAVLLLGLAHDPFHADEGHDESGASHSCLFCLQAAGTVLDVGELETFPDWEPQCEGTLEESVATWRRIGVWKNTRSRGPPGPGLAS